MTPMRQMKDSSLDLEPMRSRHGGKGKGGWGDVKVQNEHLKTILKPRIKAQFAVSNLIKASCPGDTRRVRREGASPQVRLRTEVKAPSTLAPCRRSPKMPRAFERGDQVLLRLNVVSLISTGHLAVV
jgi:hypothetical protein